MQFQVPLDSLLSSLVKVRLLRQLTLHPVDTSGRTLARLIGVSAAQTHRALHELLEQGVVSLNRVGRSHVFSLRRDTALARELLIPLFERERKIRALVVKTILREMRTPTLAVFVFGSVARETSTAESDLDLAIVTETAGNKRAAEREFAGPVGIEASALGVRLSPYVITRRELVRKYKANDPFIREIIRSGVRASGLFPLELISHGA